MRSSLAMPAGEAAERPYMRCVFEAPTDVSADYTHAGAPIPTPIQLLQTSHDNQVLYLGQLGQNNSAAPNIS